MNEQILWPILQEARQSATSGESGAHFDLDVYEAKLAELIVRECIDIISPYALHMENYDGGHPITDIKNHFGVK
jgi:hypothetical protein